MAPLVSGHGSALRRHLDSSILPTSDTASVSSDALQHQDVPSTSHQFQLSKQEQQGQDQEQQQHQPTPGLDLEANITHQPTSDTDTLHHPLPSRHSAADSLSTLTSAISTPAASGVSSDSTAPLPPPFKSPIKRKPLSASASSLAASLSLRDSAGAVPPPLNPELLPKPDQRFSRSPSIDSPTFYDYPHSLRISLSSSK